MRTTTNGLFELIQALPGDLLGPIQTFQEEVDLAIAGSVINSAHTTIATVDEDDIGRSFRNLDPTANNFALHGFGNAAADQVYIGVQNLGAGATAGGDYLVATNPIGGSAPVERLRISSEGVYTAGPLGALTDGSSWALSQVRFTQNLDPSNGKFYLMNLQPYATAVSGGSAYEKAGLIIQAKTNDPSTGGIDRDMVGIDSRATIVAANPSGRVWGGAFQGIIEAGGDGRIVAVELSVVNGGDDQPLINQNDSKIGLHIVAGGNGASAGIQFTGSGGGFHKMLYAEPANILGTHADDCFFELLGVAKMRKDGSLGLGTGSPLTKLNVVETGSASPRGILSSQFSTDTNGARVGFAKARGSVASPTTVASGDTLGRLTFRGYDGANYLEMASIEAGISGTVASTRVPTFLAFSTATDAAPSVLTERLRIDNAGNAGFGTPAPNAKLTVSANTGIPPTAPTGTLAYWANADAVSTFHSLDSYGTGIQSCLLFRTARGTMASPTATQSADLVGHIQARGYGATGFTLGAKASIRFIAAENWTDTAQGMYLSFFTTPNTTTTIAEAMRITDAGLVIVSGLTASRALATDASKGLVSSAVTATELGHVSGVTSAIQTQLNTKQATVTGVSDTEIGYLDGVTSLIQPQLAARVPINKNVVLHLDGDFQTVNFGKFWTGTADVDIGIFFWEAWCRPDNTGLGYLLSDGYGGAHAILFGFSVGSGRQVMTGNVWDGTAIVTFGADDSPATGEWCLVGVSWDGNYITTYLNGIPVGSVAWAGPRLSPGAGAGASVLYVGGSDHLNYTGMLAQVRGWEGTNPIGPFTDGTNFVPQPYVPETLFGVRTVANIGAPPILLEDPIANLLANFLTSRSIVPDHIENRVGVLQNNAGNNGSPTGFTYPLPDYQLDTGAPNYDPIAGPTAPVELIASPPSVPGGARVFDSFNRANRTYCFGGSGGLGSTEGGSAGVKAWVIETPDAIDFAPGNFGILNGLAVSLNSNQGLAWVSAVGTADMDVRVDRRAGSWLSGINTGIAFRILDRDNFLFAYTTGLTAAGTTLHISKWVSGTRTDDLVTAIAMPSSWTTLRVLCAGTSVKVYADATEKINTTVSDHSTQTGAGLWNAFGSGGGLGSRWDNFTVF